MDQINNFANRWQRPLELKENQKLSGLSKIRCFFSSRWNIYLWQKANSFSSRSKPKMALDIYLKLHLPSGLKQIALAQTANMYYRIGDKKKAMDFYNKAIESERSWGQRPNEENSKYLTEYCYLFMNFISEESCGAKATSKFDRQLADLKMLPVSERLKKYYLPLPSTD